MSSQKPLVLVTGGTGFVGSHVIEQLLQAGYAVRATARPGKGHKLKDTYPYAGTNLDVVEVASLTSDHSDAFRDIGALVHVASPIYKEGAVASEILDGAVNGTVNIVNAAVKSGVKKIVYTSTFATLIDPDFKRAFSTEPLNEKNWSSVTLDQIDPATQSTMFVYLSAKAVSEKKIWEFAKQNPEIDFTTIIPPAIYGPFVKNYPQPESPSALGTTGMAYHFLSASDTYPPIHIAKAHVLALSAPLCEDGEQKRLIVAAGVLSWHQVAEFVKEKRPDLAHRLPKEGASLGPQTSAPLDTALTEKVLGLKSFISPENTLLDAVDAAVDWENSQS